MKVPDELKDCPEGVQEYVRELQKIVLLAERTRIAQKRYYKYRRESTNMLEKKRLLQECKFQEHDLDHLLKYHSEEQPTLL